MATTQKAPAAQDIPTTRINLPRYLTPHPQRDGYVISYGSHGSGKTPVPSFADEDVHAEKIVKYFEIPGQKINAAVQAAVSKLRQDSEQMKNSINLESGPYAERQGKVAALVEEVKRLVAEAQPLAEKDSYGSQAEWALGTMAKQSTKRELIMECGMDIVRPYEGEEAEYALPRLFQSENYRFIVDSEGQIPVPKELGVAGVILADGDRQGSNSAFGQFTVLVSLTESFILLASLLRRLGISAYPSLAVQPAQDGGETYAPIMSVLDFSCKDAPLQTFSLARVHPPLGAVIIMSDLAVEAATYGLLAETMVRHLIPSIYQHGVKKDAVITPKAFAEQLAGISGALFECQKRWPDNVYLSNALEFLFKHVSSALTGIAVLKEGFDPANPPMGIVQAIMPFAGQKANEIAGHVFNDMAKMLQKAGLTPPQLMQAPM